MSHFAVITGATQGIGRAVAERFLQAGWNIAVCARSEADLQAVQQQWQAQYPDSRILVFKADLADRDSLNLFAAAIAESGMPVDVLVNNAGLFFPGDLATEPEGQLESLMAVNVYSAYYLSRALLPGMKERRSGHIFNLCSVASLRSYPAGGAYSITKYALLGFSENLRNELRETGVRVTALCPGATWSRSWSGSGVPEERVMAAEDVAAMVWASWELSLRADVEMIVMRPMLGDL